MFLKTKTVQLRKTTVFKNIFQLYNCSKAGKTFLGTILFVQSQKKIVLLI